MNYIGLLRGINVGGHTVKMEQLKVLFQECGLTAVRSFIASGNIFFESDRVDREELSEEIAEHLFRALGFHVPVFLRTAVELEAIIALNPFKDVVEDENIRLCVVFLAKSFVAPFIPPLVSKKGDVEIIAVVGREAYVVWRIVSGKAPTPSLTDQVFGKQTTTRFFHTTAKILQAALSD